MNPCPALAAIERAHGVRILLAVESGSRAWGFPSGDSDFDVRFLYLRSLHAYLSVDAGRDTIEHQPAGHPAEGGILDLGGWDVRKALNLLARSNAAAMEWLRSPIVYQHDPEAHAALSALAHDVAHLPALAYHYDRLARHALPPGTDVVRPKSYFYAIRPALALSWMQRHGTPPPMDLPTLLSGTPVPDPVRSAIEAMRTQKAAATEADTTPRAPVLDEWLAGVLAHPAPRPAPWDQAAAVAAADALFRRLLRV